LYKYTVDNQQYIIITRVEIHLQPYYIIMGICPSLWVHRGRKITISYEHYKNILYIIIIATHKRKNGIMMIIIITSLYIYICVCVERPSLYTICIATRDPAEGVYKLLLIYTLDWYYAPVCVLWHICIHGESDSINYRATPCVYYIHIMYSGGCSQASA